MINCRVSLSLMWPALVLTTFALADPQNCGECVAAQKTFMTIATDSGVMNHCVDTCNVTTSRTWHYLQCNTDCGNVVDVGLRDPSQLLTVTSNLLPYSDTACRMQDCETCQTMSNCAYKTDGMGEYVCMPNNIKIDSFFARGCISSCEWCAKDGTFLFRSVAGIDHVENRCVAEEYCIPKLSSMGHVSQCANVKGCSTLVNPGIPQESLTVVGDYEYDEGKSCMTITNCTKCQENPNCGWAEDSYYQQGCVPKALRVNGIIPQDDCSLAPNSATKQSLLLPFMLMVFSITAFV